MKQVAKKTCLIALIGLMGGFFFIASAQEHGWNKTYLADRPVMLFAGVEYDSTGYKVVGVTDGHTNNLGAGVLANVNFNGDLTDYKIIIDSVYASYGIYTNAFIKTTYNRFAFTGLSYDSLAYLLFGFSNTGMDTIKVFRYYTSNTFAYHGFCLVEKDNAYYIAGVRTDSIENDPNVVLVKVDAVGNRIWERKYGLVNRYETAQSITLLTNGHLMIGAERIDVDHIPQRANTWLIEVDTAGSIIRQWLDNTDSTYAAYGLKQTADGGFVYGCQKKFEQHTSTITYTGNITKLNSNFTKQWVFNDGYLSIYNGVSDIELLSNGDIIACGQKRSEFEDTTVSYGWVVKFDPVGNIYWNRVYSGVNTPNTKNYLRDIDILPDGSMIAVGECDPRSGSSPQLGWFLRLDANGCELENCTWGTPNAVDEITDNQQIHLYPNPAQSAVTVEYGDVDKSSRLIIVNMAGKVVESMALPTGGKLTLNTGSYSNGVYLVRIEADGEVLLKDKLVITK